MTLDELKTCLNGIEQELKDGYVGGALLLLHELKKNTDGTLDAALAYADAKLTKDMEKSKRIDKEQDA